MAPVYVRSVSEFGAPRETFGDGDTSYQLYPLSCGAMWSARGRTCRVVCLQLKEEILAPEFIWVYFHYDVMQFTISLQFVIIAGATILFFIFDPRRGRVQSVCKIVVTQTRTTPTHVHTGTYAHSP